MARISALRSLLSKTKVSRKFESNSQQIIEDIINILGCQRPKLVENLKAIHNLKILVELGIAVVKDQS